MPTSIPHKFTTPDKVATPIGTLEFFDGVPPKETVEAVYDYVDRARAVEVFINMIPAVSMVTLRQGQRDMGASECNQILIWEDLMDSKSLVLTGNNTSLYTWGFLDLKKDGPTVIELPPDVLGILDDMYFRYIADMGAAYLFTDPDAKGKAADVAAVAAWNLNKRPEALQFAEAALQHFPADPRIVNNVTEMRQQLAQAS